MPLVAAIRILRPLNCLITFASVLLGGWLGARGLSGSLLTAGVSAATITGAGNALNDIVDIRRDRVNRPDRPLAAAICRSEPPRFSRRRYSGSGWPSPSGSRRPLQPWPSSPSQASYSTTSGSKTSLSQATSPSHFWAAPPSSSARPPSAHTSRHWSLPGSRACTTSGARFSKTWPIRPGIGTPGVIPCRSGGDCVLP